MGLEKRKIKIGMKNFIIGSLLAVASVALLLYCKEKRLQKKFSKEFFKFSLNTYLHWIGFELTPSKEVDKPKGNIYYLDF